MTNDVVIGSVKDDKKGCLRCGHCCHYLVFDDGKPFIKRCKHLVRLCSGKTLCRVYKKALLERTKNGHMIDTFEHLGETKQVFCCWRKSGQWNYEGCPFNVDGITMFEDYLDSKGVSYPWKRTNK